MLRTFFAAGACVVELPAWDRGLGNRLEMLRRELDDALAAAVASEELCIIRVRLPRDGRSAALERLGEALRARA